MPVETLGGLPIHWRHLGAGSRRALALHCTLAHGGAWAGLAAHLPDLTLIAPDLPATGSVAILRPGDDLHNLCTRVAVALAKRQAPLDVIGHSFGATVALRMALERPELVRSLTLIEPVLFCAARAADSPAYGTFAASHAPIIAALEQGRPEEAAALFHAQWGNGRLADLPEAQRRYIIDRIGLVPRQNPALLQDSGALLAPWRLEAFGLPVLLLEGERSPPVIPAILDELQRRLPMVSRATLAGAGHMAPITHPAAVAAAILRLPG